MDYEKAYKEALERARKFYNELAACRTKQKVAAIFPELRESEDERIIKGLLSAFCDMKANYWIGMEVPKIVAWLEKQKENSKSVDSISSDCVSDAKCEDRWHKVGDSLPDSTREVLCKDAIGNYFIGRYYSKGVWEVSMYDDCDKSNEDNPPVVMWIDIPSEKQKEHLVDNSKTSADEDERIRKGLVNFLQSPFIKENLTDEKVAPWVAYLEKQKEQKPVESISQLTVQGKGVYKICPRCKERMIRDDSMVYTSMPPQYRYECPKCGEMEFDTVMYDNPEMEEQKPNIEICPHFVKSKSYSETGYPIEDCDYGLEIALDILEKTLGKVQGFQTDDGIREHQTAIKAIKDAMKEQKPAEWSKNDTVFLNEITDFFENKTVRLQHDIDMYAHWLKSLPERLVLQPKAEWSEEDERKLNRIYEILGYAADDKGFLTSKRIIGDKEAIELQDFLKSLRPSWKPSEEQMSMLLAVIRDPNNAGSESCSLALKSIYEQLKKLM